MPGELVKVKGGWKVRWGGRLMSKAALAKERATAQLRALYAREGAGKAFGGKK